MDILESHLRQGIIGEHGRIFFPKLYRFISNRFGVSDEERFTLDSLEGKFDGHDIYEIITQASKLLEELEDQIVCEPDQLIRDELKDLYNKWQVSMLNVKN